MVIAYHKKSVHLKKSQTLLVSQTLDLGGGCSATNQRLPRAVTLEAGELLFMIVGLSLKEPGDAPACSAKVRTEQVDQLLSAIESQLSFVAGCAGQGSVRPHLLSRGYEPQNMGPQEHAGVRARDRAGAEFANFIGDYSDHVPVLTSLYTDVP